MQVPISLISVPPRRKPPTDTSNLKAEIAKSGMKKPILLAKYGEILLLIDGLRRLSVARELNKADISAQVVDTYEEACTALGQIGKNSGDELSIRRIYEIYASLRPLMVARLALRQKGEQYAPSRDLLIRALGIPDDNRSSLSAIIQLYRAAEMRDDPWAQRLIKAVEEGTLTPHAARQRYSKGGFQSTGDVCKASEQRRLMGTAIATMSGIVKGLQSLGPWHPEIPQTELSVWAKELSAQRGFLAKIIQSIKTPSPPNGV